MNNRVVVSIIIPVYDVEIYLCELFESIERVNGYNIEIIFVDDCSTDMGAQLVREFIDKCEIKNISLLSHSENRGLSSARNTGLAAALGEYIWFLDSDDLISPTLNIDELVMVAGAGAVDIFLYDFHYMYYQGETFCPGNKISGTPPAIRRNYSLKKSGRRRFPPNRIVTHDDGAMAAFFEDCRAYSWSFVARRSLVAQVPFPCGAYFEDIATTPAMFALASTFYYIPSEAVLYRQRDGSIMKQMSCKKNMDIAIAMERNTKLIDDNISKFSDNDIEKWLGFYMLSIMWGLKGLAHEGHLASPMVRRRLQEAITTFRATAAEHGYRPEALLNNVGGRGERVLARLFLKVPAVVFLLSMLFNRSRIARAAIRIAMRKLS